MARNKLSETRIRTLPVGIHSDGDGLYLRVRNGGSRQWLFIFKREGKRTEIGLGGHGQGTAPVSLVLAREKAEAIRQRLARGEDLHSRKTFADVMEDVIKVKEASFRNGKHRAQWGMTLREYAKHLHKKPIASITRDDIVETLKPIWTTIPETADRTRMRIASVIDHGRRVAAICEALKSVAAARAEYDALRDEFERHDVAWGSLVPMSLNFMGDARDGHVQRYLKEAREAGYVD